MRSSLLSVLSLLALSACSSAAEVESAGPDASAVPDVVSPPADVTADASPDASSGDTEAPDTGPPPPALPGGVGVMETTGFAKFVFTGSDARSYLDSIITNRLPAPGRMVLAPMVNHNGKLIGDLTVAYLGPTPGAAEGPSTTATGGATQNTGDQERFVVFGSGVATRYYDPPRTYGAELTYRF